MKYSLLKGQILMTKPFRKKYITMCLLLLFIAFANYYGHRVLAENKKSNLTVHFLDIGQADSVLIQTPDGQTALIDSGNESDSMYIQGYLLNLGIKKIDVLIQTHPHEDHIGSMDDIVYSFEIGTVYALDTDYDNRANTNFKEAIERKGYTISHPKVGDSFKLGDACFQFISPKKSKYKKLNHCSLVTKMKYSKTSFLFMGDAEEIAVDEIIDSDDDLQANVIKIGHHGSSGSTPVGLIKKAQPEYAVITTRKNSKIFPHIRTNFNLKVYGVKPLLTAGNGTIVATSDGEKIHMTRSPYKNTDRESLIK